MKKTNKLTAIILTCVMVLSMLLNAQNVSAAEFGASQTEMEALLGECYSGMNVSFQYGKEWDIINYARMGTVTDEQKQAYCDSVKAKLQENGMFASATDTERVALALYALQCDPTDVGGFNLVEPLQEVTEYTGKSLYSLSYAVMVLQNGGYEINPEFISKILELQTENGSFSKWGDVDTVAMAIMGLAPFYGTNEQVKAAVDKGIEYMATATDSYKANSNSMSQVVLGLLCVGKNPVDDTRFTFDGKNIMQALYGFYCGDGKFGFNNATKANAMATQQCIQAMISYDRFTKNKTFIFDLSDLRQPEIPDPPAEPIKPAEPEKPAETEKPVAQQYPVLEGNNQTVDATQEGTLSIRIDCPIEKFVGVEMDGVMVDPKYYTVKSGSTIVTFTSEYVKTLKAGAHAVTVNFTDGSATVGVTVAQKSEEPKKDTQTNETASQAAVAVQAEKSPKTGESFPIAVCVMMALMAGAVVCTRKRA